MSDHIRCLKIATRVSLAAVALFILLPSVARAQASPSAARAAARAEMELREKSWDLEKLKREKPAESPDTRPDYSEVAEEFQRLQVVNNSLVGVADPKTPLDYARVRKESAEVRKRAARLKEYLVLPEVEGAPKPEKGAEIQTPEALRTAVKKLDGLVNSFAWNPVFQRPDVVDLELSSKASRDLAGILSLSEQIRKSAEELGKAARAVVKK